MKVVFVVLVIIRSRESFLFSPAAVEWHLLSESGMENLTIIMIIMIIMMIIMMIIIMIMLCVYLPTSHFQLSLGSCFFYS